MAFAPRLAPFRGAAAATVAAPKRELPAARSIMKRKPGFYWNTNENRHPFGACADLRQPQLSENAGGEPHFACFIHGPT